MNHEYIDELEKEIEHYYCNIIECELRRETNATLVNVSLYYNYIMTKIDGVMIITQRDFTCLSAIIDQIKFKYRRRITK